MPIIHLPEIDPVALQLGFISIRWYSLAYIFGILFAMFFLKSQNNRRHLMSAEAYDNWLLYAVLSIIIGGRVGYVLFYNFDYFLSNPLEIFAVWHGGMSFHGGLLGSILGSWLFCKKYKVNFLEFCDVMCIAAPIGIFLGRVANFMNLELYGRPTKGNYGVVFPGAGDMPRHPSQLYEGFLEGLLMFIILFLLSRFTKIQDFRGRISGLFLVLYGSFRIIIENFREPDSQLGFIFSSVTMGQILSLPLIALGLWLVVRAERKNYNPK